MNQDEEVAGEYLRSLGIGLVVYEPDGNIPPDFLVGGRIAAEVRRLNQTVEIDGSISGIETVEAAILKFFQKILPQSGRPIGGRSWFVFYTFRRPLEWKFVRSQVKKILESFDGSSDAKHFRVSDTFELDIQIATHQHPHRFMLGAYADRDAGGFLGSEIIRNAKMTILEKSRKIEPYRRRYDEWWLLLVDRIGPKLNAFERDDLPNHIDVQDWDRVVLLDPTDINRALRLGGR